MGGESPLAATAELAGRDWPSAWRPISPIFRLSALAAALGIAGSAFPATLVAVAPCHASLHWKCLIRLKKGYRCFPEWLLYFARSSIRPHLSEAVSQLLAQERRTPLLLANAARADQLTLKLL